jgi:hypothetical protein
MTVGKWARIAWAALLLAFGGTLWNSAAVAQGANAKVTTFTVIAGHRAERRGRRGRRRIDHQAGRRDPRLPADPARHRARRRTPTSSCGTASTSSAGSSVLPEREGRAERRGLRRHRADGHRRGPLHRQAQPACLDVAVANALIYVENIRKALVKHDPANAATYNANAAAYAAQDQGARRAAAQAARGHPEAQRWLVTSEGAFSYLARDSA